MNHLIIGYIAGILAFLQLIPYLVSIFRGHTKPERATYAIWSLVNIIIVSSYIASGAHTTIWVGVAYAVSQILVFGLSFKYGVGGFNKFDVMCLLLALTGAGIWISTSNPLIALYFSLTVKAMGLMPTLRKVYYRPDTENTISWVICATASALNMFALVSFAPNIAILPIYSLLGDGAVALMVLFPKVRPKRNHRTSAILYGAEAN
jgi:hypothetical protein